MRLAAGLYPDSLGELEPLAAIGGGVLLQRGRDKGGEEGRG